jgi:hypothetical protein
MTLKVGDTFTDPEAAAKHGNKDVSDQILITGADTVDTSKAGTYEVKYTIEVDDVDDEGKPIKKKQEKTRKVEVKEAVEDEKLSLNLKGANPFEIEVGETFTDLGAEAFLGAKDVSKDIVVDGIDKIDNSKPGDYEVRYTITKEETINGKKELKTLEEVRIVRVKEIAETIDPDLELTLKGDKTLTLKQGTDYNEPGREAKWRAKGEYHSAEEDVSNEVEVEGEVDPNVPGTYTLTYTITKEYTDNEGKKHTKTTTAKRTIVVEKEDDIVPPPPPPPVEDFEISAVLDDVTASVTDSIAREVENQLKDERNHMSRYNPKRMVRFFSRGAKRKKMINQALADRKEK